MHRALLAAVRGDYLAVHYRTSQALAVPLPRPNPSGGCRDGISGMKWLAECSAAALREALREDDLAARFSALGIDPRGASRGHLVRWP